MPIRRKKRLKSPGIDNTQKLMIIGALGYFILPLDLIPDAIPMTGFADDVAAITFVLKSLSAIITPEMRRETKDQLYKWIGDYDESLTSGVDKVIDLKANK